jgi:hypothetical protein
MRLRSCYEDYIETLTEYEQSRIFGHITGRRGGDAWLVVESGSRLALRTSALAQRLAVLDALPPASSSTAAAEQHPMQPLAAATAAWSKYRPVRAMRSLGRAA